MDSIKIPSDESLITFSRPCVRNFWTPISRGLGRIGVPVNMGREVASHWMLGDLPTMDEYWHRFCLSWLEKVFGTPRGNFGRWCSFLIGWFLGSMLVFRGLNEITLNKSKRNKCVKWSKGIAAGWWKSVKPKPTGTLGHMMLILGKSPGLPATPKGWKPKNTHRN